MPFKKAKRKRKTLTLAEISLLAMTRHTPNDVMSLASPHLNQRSESEYLSCWPRQCREEAMIALLITLIITPGPKKERVVQPKSLLPQKLGLFFSSVFGKKKSPKASSKVHKNGDGYKSDVAVVDGGLHDGDQPPEVAPKSPLHLLEIEEEEEEGENGKSAIDRRENKPSRAADMYLKVSFPFLSFFTKYTGLNFFRGKTITDHTVLRRQGTSHNLASGAPMSETPAGRQESSGNLLRNPSRVPSTRGKIGGKPGQAGEESREESGDELCKKRILMGEKCKPLNLSGSLHYDEDGILLPEVLLR
ncbi:F2P16.13 PROTEIN-RELATED [Salix purpurea]|uniref:F2P16.13 PROTEIN-RELATED n=1 Tax=Salix purpurea TaxID=77065 RepID=A0A9Q0W8H2_SALPP|nr:F2P16.13 PROTEIN-RELATED [Salix purpurea]